MSRRELSRAEVLAGVKSRQLRLVEGGVVIGLGYREEGTVGLKHRSAASTPQARLSYPYGDQWSRFKVLLPSSTKITPRSGSKIEAKQSPVPRRRGPPV